MIQLIYILMFLINGSGFNNYPYGIVQQTNGKYLLDGGFTAYNGTTADRIVRLNQDGTRG